MKILTFSRIVILVCLCCSMQVNAQIHFRSYHPGHYYDKQGKRFNGFIDFGKDFFGEPKINFKPDSLKAPNQKIDVLNLQSIVVQTESDGPASSTDDSGKKPDSLAKPKMVMDSFIVVQETINDSNELTTRLVLYILSSVNSEIYSRQEQRSTGGFGMMMGSMGPLAIVGSIGINYGVTVYLCNLDGTVVQLRRSNYRDILSKAFSDDPDLVQKIQTKEIRYGDLDEMINLYKRFKTK